MYHVSFVMQNCSPHKIAPLIVIPSRVPVCHSKLPKVTNCKETICLSKFRQTSTLKWIQMPSYCHKSSFCHAKWCHAASAKSTTNLHSPNALERPSVSSLFLETPLMYTVGHTAQVYAPCNKPLFRSQKKCCAIVIWCFVTQAQSTFHYSSMHLQIKWLLTNSNCKHVVVKSSKNESQHLFHLKPWKTLL